MSILAIPGQIITANDIDEYNHQIYGTSYSIPSNWLNAGVSFPNEPQQAEIFDDEYVGFSTWYGKMSGVTD